MKKNITLAVAALAMLIVLAPAANAVCSPSKEFGTWDFNDGAYYYVNGFNGDTAGTIGAFWQPGSRATHNEGGYAAENYIGLYAGTSWYISGSLGDGRVVGCPSTEMVLVLTQPDGTFAIGQADETLAKANAYNYGDLNFAPLPRPRVTGSSRDAGNVVVDLTFDAIDAGFSSRFGRNVSESVNEIVLYSFHGTADPGRDAGAWTEMMRIPFAGGTTDNLGVSVGCADDGGDTFIAAGLGFGGEYTTQHLSASTVLECDPTLADPDGKFDLIRERGKGQKKGKPFRDR